VAECMSRSVRQGKSKATRSLHDRVDTSMKEAALLTAASVVWACRCMCMCMRMRNVSSSHCLHIRTRQPHPAHSIPAAGSAAITKGYMGSFPAAAACFLFRIGYGTICMAKVRWSSCCVRSNSAVHEMPFCSLITVGFGGARARSPSSMLGVSGEGMTEIR
jgi:hypothetical protein